MSLLLAKGGVKAAAFWFARVLFRLDVYQFYAVSLASPTYGPATAVKGGFAFLEFGNYAELRRVHPHIIAQLDAHSGAGVAETVRQGGRVYAMMHDDRVAAQLRADLGRVKVGTPLDLWIDSGDQSAFISFLHTNPLFQRRGLASYLIARVCSKLASEGIRLCVCHIQATNVRSINTFTRSGWLPVAALVVTVGGRRIGVLPYRGARRLRLRLVISSAAAR